MRAFSVLPLKASVIGNGRRIVYLDQNVVSDLAKLRLGRIGDGECGAALREIADALQESVFRKQTARCVESFFHHWESSELVAEKSAREGAVELFEAIWKLLVTHSWGLHLELRESITRFQTLVSVASRTGRLQYDPKYLWRGAFSDDPHESNETAGVEWGGDLFMLGVQWKPQSILHPGWAQRVEKLRAAGRYGTFETARREMGDEFRAWAIECNRWSSWAIHWGDMQNPMPRKDVDDFIVSEAFLELPLADVGTRLHARVLSDRGRKLSDSDASDMTILSLAIPYCDLVVTDRYMASLSRELRLDANYKTAVIPTSTAGLLEAAHWLRAG
jgi:hypothetical protein